MANEIDSLPDVNLQEVVDDLTQQEKDKAKEKDEILDLGQFKNPKDLLKSYKEVQGAFTKVTQSIKEKEAEIARLQDELELGQGAPQGYQPPPAPQQPEYNAYEDPEVTVARQVNQTLIANVLEEEQSKDRIEFGERYAYVQMLAKQYPHLSNTPSGVKTLFKKADQVREERQKVASQKALQTIFGKTLDEGELQKLREVVGVKKNEEITEKLNISDAYMPGTTSASRSRTDPEPTNFDSKIDAAVESGDVDATLNALFEKALSE